MWPAGEHSTTERRLNGERWLYPKQRDLGYIAEAGRRPEEQFKVRFWKHLPPPAVCLLSTKKLQPMTQVPKQFKNNLSALCSPAILHIREQGITSS